VFVSNTVGVLFVHGIGSQVRGSTLAQFGDPLIRWLEQWAAGHGGMINLRTVGDAGASSPAYVVCDWHHPRHGSIEVTLAECWWAESFAPPSLGAFLKWAPRMAYRAMWRLTKFWWAVPVGVLFLTLYFYAGALPYVAAFMALCALVALLLPIVVLLLIGGLLILPATRGLATSAVGTLGATAGDAHALMRSPVRFSAMRTRFADDLAWLSDRVDKTVVVAHSQGSVIAVETMAVAPQTSDALVTVGNALRLLRRDGSDPVATLSDRLDRPVWVDVYSQVDPVSAGPVETSGPYPVEIMAQNSGSALMAHTTYVDNQEAFQMVLVSVIGHAATGGNILNDDESRQVRDALRAREGRSAVRFMVRAQSLLAVIAGTLWLTDQAWPSRSLPWATTSDLVPELVREWLPTIAAIGIGPLFLSALAAMTAVAFYGVAIVMPVFNAWHRRDARALAAGERCPRVSLAKVLVVLAIGGLGAIPVGALLPTSDTPRGLLAFAAAGLAVILAVLSFVLTGGEADPPVWLERLPPRFAKTFGPLYPAFAYKIFQYSRATAAIPSIPPDTPTEDDSTMP
jgi:hypothetical protein